MEEKILGVDIGATKIHLGVVENSEVIQEFSVPTSAGATKDEILQILFQCIEKLEPTNYTGIGIGVPGLIDQHKGIVYDLLNINSWKEVHLKDLLQEKFKVPVEVTNDANVYAIGEKVFGAGRSFDNFVGLTLGSGLGTGIIVDNRVYSGNFSGAGEIGSLPYLDATYEDYCSGKFFSRKNLDGKEVYDQATKGDTQALKIFEEYGKHVGEAVKVLIHVLSPEAVLLGGSISKSFSYFEKSLHQSINNFPFRRITDKLIIKPSRTKNIPVLGAAALIISHREKRSQKNLNITT